jgi:hypothetical protein
VCGFGPPNSGRIIIEGVTEWAEQALQEPKIVRPSLETAGWDEPGIRSFLASYDKLRGANVPHPTIIDRIRELLGQRTQIETEISEDVIKVPLYRFGAPPIPGAVVSYSEGSTNSEMTGWGLKVLSVGIGRTTDLAVHQTKTFEAKHGTYKEIFAKVRLRVAKIATYEGVRRVGTGYRAEVVLPKKNRETSLRGRGCDDISAETCRQSMGEDAVSPLEYWFAGDSSGAIHSDERSWDFDVAKQLSLRLQNHVEVSALVRIKRLRRLALAIRLPAGHDYYGHVGRRALWWERP